MSMALLPGRRSQLPSTRHPGIQAHGPSAPDPGRESIASGSLARVGASAIRQRAPQYSNILPFPCPPPRLGAPLGRAVPPSSVRGSSRENGASPTRRGVSPGEAMPAPSDRGISLCRAFLVSHFLRPTLEIGVLIPRMVYFIDSVKHSSIHPFIQSIFHPSTELS